ncbi:unnamed protein product, partial [Ixodes pacificus]
TSIIIIKRAIIITTSDVRCITCQFDWEARGVSLVTLVNFSVTSSFPFVSPQGISSARTMPQVASRHSGVSSRPSSRWGDTVLRQFDDDTATFLSRDCHTWSCFTVTTPSGLTKERFEEKSRDLASELQRRLNLSQPPVIRVRHRATMGSTHRPSLFFSVSYVGVVQQTKLRGILSCFGSEEHNLLLCRGSRLVMSLVTVFVADAFRCYVNPLLFGPGDLAFGLAFWSALAFRVSGFDGDFITIQLKHPDVPNFA